MNCRVRIFACLVMALTVAAASEAADVSVHNAWIRVPPPGMEMMAGYMTLRNNTARPQALVSASSPGFKTVTIHRTIVKDGMAGMVHVPPVELKPDASWVFEPGGYHLMLMNPKRALRAGDRIDIVLEFRSGLRSSVSFEVRE